MPELPEIEIVKRSLFKKINKAKIVNIHPLQIITTSTSKKKNII